MQRLWSADELGERWSLLPGDLALLAGRIDAGKLGFAVQLAFWRQHGRFPDDEADVAPAVVAHLAAQIGVGVDALDGYAWAGRSGRRHRVAIITTLRSRRSTRRPRPGSAAGWPTTRCRASSQRRPWTRS